VRTRRLVLFNKPFRVLSERSGEPGKRTVADYVPFADVDPAGRLDFDSEGLVILTNVGWLQHLIAHPRHKQPKTYWVQVEGAPSAEAILRLEQGVVLRDGPTQRARVRRMAAPAVWPRDPPVQERRDLAATWLAITMFEGRKRQVRRMTAAVGHPALRLIRVAVGPWRLGGLGPGEWREAFCPPDAESFRRAHQRRGARRG